MDIEKSRAFIDARGSDLEKARFHCILDGTIPGPEVCQSLFALQNPDGGFPFEMYSGNLSTLNETTVALWWLEELDLLASPAACRVFEYLLRSQQANGSWDEDSRLAQYELPPWIQL